MLLALAKQKMLIGVYGDNDKPIGTYPILLANGWGFTVGCKRITSLASYVFFIFRRPFLMRFLPGCVKLMING